MSDMRMLAAMPPTSATTAIPMMESVTSSSTSVSPGSRRVSTSDAHLVVDAVHRRDERDRDEAHDEAHDHDDRRFEERDQLLQPVVQLTFVVAGGDLQLGSERSGL